MSKVSLYRRGTRRAAVLALASATAVMLAPAAVQSAAAQAATSAAAVIGGAPGISPAALVDPMV